MEFFEIEDNNEHIQTLIEKEIFCIYFRDPSQSELKNVVEVHNWGEIYRAIEDNGGG